MTSSPRRPGFICHLAVAALLLVSAHAALSQDRPLLEPFRIGYARSDAIGDRLRSSQVLMQSLWRKGHLLSWHPFADGFAALRALDAEQIDVALGVNLSDVIAAKRQNFKMASIAELRSIAPTCCDLEQIFHDHTYKRYTLSSEYLANYREHLLLILHQEIVRAVQREPAGPEREVASPDALSLTAAARLPGSE